MLLGIGGVLLSDRLAVNRLALRLRLLLVYNDVTLWRVNGMVPEVSMLGSLNSPPATSTRSNRAEAHEEEKECEGPPEPV